MFNSCAGFQFVSIYAPAPLATLTADESPNVAVQHEASMPRRSSCRGADKTVGFQGDEPVRQRSSMTLGEFAALAKISVAYRQCGDSRFSSVNADISALSSARLLMTRPSASFIGFQNWSVQDMRFGYLIRCRATRERYSPSTPIAPCAITRDAKPENIRSRQSSRMRFRRRKRSHRRSQA